MKIAKRVTLRAPRVQRCRGGRVGGKARLHRLALVGR